MLFPACIHGNPAITVGSSCHHCCRVGPSPLRSGHPLPRAFGQLGGSDMAGPSWLPGGFAAVMITVAAYSAGRLAVSRLRGRITEPDADGLHVVMGVAMAGMLVPRLNVLPAGVWAGVFAAAAGG